MGVDQNPAHYARDPAFANLYMPRGGELWKEYPTDPFVPVVSQGVSINIAKTINYSQWRYDGSMIEFECFLSMTAAGTLGSPVTVSIPVGMAYSFANLGSVGIYHAGFDQLFTGIASDAGGQKVLFYTDGSPGAGYQVALAVNHQIRMKLRYRWA